MTKDSELPFVAPCRSLHWLAGFRWLQQGWRDFLAARRASFLFGLLALLSSHAVSFLAWSFGSLGLLLGIVTGFVFVGPLLALTLYSVSAQLERGKRVRLVCCFRDARRAAGNALVFATVLLIIFLVWARAASMVHVFFPNGGEEEGLALFLLVGSLVGALFAAIVFTVSAFSLPMLIDRQVDTITAVVTSVNAVLRNKPAALTWGLLVVALTLLSALTAFIGLVVILPVLGYATWHAYRDAIDAHQWPTAGTD